MKPFTKLSSRDNHSFFQIRTFSLNLGLNLFLILFLTACPEPPSEKPKHDTTIHLEVLSTFTTTVRLHISVEDTTAAWTFGLTRNGEDVLTAYSI